MHCSNCVKSRAAAAVGEGEGGGGGGDLQVTYRPRVNHDAREAETVSSSQCSIFFYWNDNWNWNALIICIRKGETSPLMRGLSAVVADPRVGLEKKCVVGSSTFNTLGMGMQDIVENNLIDGFARMALFHYISSVHCFGTDQKERRGLSNQCNSQIRTLPTGEFTQPDK